MKRIKPVHWFFISWILITGLSGIWEHFTSPPDGMHQGAQTDRACIAWNYYNESMNFFKPRVMENRISDGVTGMEFPVINYTAALLYKIAGPHEWLYRMLMFLIVSSGVFAAFLITGFFVVRTFTRLVLIYAWFLSPIFLFYSNSFVPDPAALSFTMVSLYFFFRFFFQINTRRSLHLYLFFTAMAGLIKITYLIPHFAIACIYLISYFKPLLIPQGLPRLRYSLFWWMLPLIPVASWYTYSGWLTRKTGNMHFLQQSNPAKSIPEFLENTRYAFNTWQDSVYAPNMLYIIMGLFLVFLLIKWKEAPLPALMAALISAGFLVAFIFFNYQYRYHDYYFFLLLLPLFFMLLFLEQVHLEGRTFFNGILPVALIIGFYYLPFGNYFHAKKMLKERYTPGSYYHQVFPPGVAFYDSFRAEFNQFIPENAEIFSAFDPSPNTSLYFLRRRGVRIAGDFSPEIVNTLLHQYPHRYIIINDSAKWEKEYEPLVKTGKKLLYQKGIMSIWEVPPRTSDTAN